MSLGSFFHAAWSDLVKAEHAVVTVMQKAAGIVPEVEAVAQKYGPEIGALASAIIPSAGKYTDVAVKAAVVIGQAIETGGAAAEQQFLNFGADAAFIADIKSLWSNIKTAAASGQVQPGLQTTSVTK